MLKKILFAAAAIAAMGFGASQASAGYGHGDHYSHGYNYLPAYSYSYSSYQPSCYYKTVPVMIPVWNDYYCQYTYKTVYRSINSCY